MTPVIDRDLLLALLRTPTAGPLEGGTPRLWHAQRMYARAAGALGFRTVHHGPAGAADLAGADVPLIVRERLGDPGFLAAQPNLVLRLGPALPARDTVMCNVHLDTVAGLEPVREADGRVFGRGAIDAKGPAVALLAGVRAALAVEPALGRDVGVLIQAVSGEEGGAMGTVGTRALVRAGFVGRLNVFCEPTGLRYQPRATAAATARISVRGRGTVDDRPGEGHNATVLLGYLAQHLATALSTQDGRCAVAGLHTGHRHNRVYGTGELLLNLAYDTPEAGRRLESALAREIDRGLAGFRDAFGTVPDLALTAADASRVTGLDWLKRGLPTLDATDAWGEALLTDAVGLDRWPAHEPAFSCDAIWMHGVPDAYTVVLGPGDLATNRAHAEGEHADLADLVAFAEVVERILVVFARERERARAGKVPA